ncbi:unnamed protein product [Gordionus sp. m RMFG-2023]
MKNIQFKKTQKNNDVIVYLGYEYLIKGNGQNYISLICRGKCGGRAKLSLVDVVVTKQHIDTCKSDPNLNNNSRLRDDQCIICHWGRYDFDNDIYHWILNLAISCETFKSGQAPSIIWKANSKPKKIMDRLMFCKLNVFGEYEVYFLLYTRISNKKLTLIVFV